MSRGAILWTFAGEGARYLVAAVGCLSAANVPKIPGLETFAGPLLASLPESKRPAARDATVELLRPALCDDEGNWTADYVRLRFAARKPV